MGKLGTLALAHGITNFNEQLTRSSIKSELHNHTIPPTNVRRAHYKAVGVPGRSAMDEISDAIKATLPAEFDACSNSLVNSVVKIVVSSSESDARAAARRREKRAVANEAEDSAVQVCGLVLSVQVSWTNSDRSRRSMTLTDEAVDQTAHLTDLLKQATIAKEKAMAALQSAKSLHEIEKEIQMEKLIEARLRRECATVQLTQKIIERDAAALAAVQARIGARLA